MLHYFFLILLFLSTTFTCQPTRYKCYSQQFGQTKAQMILEQDCAYCYQGRIALDQIVVQRGCATDEQYTILAPFHNEFTPKYYELAQESGKRFTLYEGRNTTETISGFVIKVHAAPVYYYIQGCKEDLCNNAIQITSSLLPLSILIFFQ